MPDITIAAGGDRFGAYLATPAAGKGPGLVVIQEIFGVNAGMRALCDEFARDGFVALCPDLFWRQSPGVQLNDQSPADNERAFKLMNGFDFQKGLGDLVATLAHARRIGTGKAGCIGYCLGGSLAFFMGCTSDSDASVGYYPVQIDAKLAAAQGIKKPVMLHLAEKDAFCPPEAQARIKDGLKGNTLVTIHSYPGVDHAFARKGGKTYDKAAATLADSRSIALLKQALA